MSHTFTWEEKGVHLKYRGVVTPEEVDTGSKELYGDPRADSLKYIIWDISEIEQLLLDINNLTLPASQSIGASYYMKNIKGAMIASDDYSIKVCNRYIEIMKSLNISWDIRVFRNIEDARKWVNKGSIAA